LTNGAARALFYNNTILSETTVAGASNIHWRNNLFPSVIRGSACPSRACATDTKPSQLGPQDGENTGVFAILKFISQAGYFQSPNFGSLFSRLPDEQPGTQSC
jgi:hypothetical protein